MRNLFFVLILVIFPVPALSQESKAGELEEMMTAYEARGWEAVGRLNIGWGGMCTGALIEPDVVLTAGHCAYDSQSGDLVEPSQIVFHAGWRNGRATASRRVKRVVVHPGYNFEGTEGNFDVSEDLALFQLASAIRLPNVVPYDTGNRPRKGQSVGVVSYAHDRDDSPSIQRVCHVLARQRNALILSCSVDFGSSGAPIFEEVDGTPRIVSVVSAKSQIYGRPVSLGTNLVRPLSEMLAILRNGGGELATPEINIVTPRVNNVPRNSNIGAKFVKP